VAVAASGMVVAAAGPARAWKPPTHLYAVEGALQDALDGDHSVTIEPVDGSAPVTVPVDPTIEAALAAHPEAYLAGTAGPDAYPDILFGQGQIHPDTRTHNDDPDPATHKASDAAYSTEWLSYLWKQAWQPIPDQDERLRRIAFALGYMGGHANGDTWAHTWINQMAGGVFPDFTDLANADISVRHVLIEGYVDKHRPGADGDNRTTYAMAAPLDFVGDTLVLSDFARSHSSSPIYDYFFGKEAALQVDVAKRDFDLDHTDCLSIDPDCYKQTETLHVDTATGPQDVVVHWWKCIGATIGCAPDPTDIIEPFDHVISSYEHHWIDDITSGLRAWPGVSEAIAQQLFDGGDLEFAPIQAALKDWILNHLLSMMGLPDFVGEGIFAASEFIGKIVSFVTGAISDVVDVVTDALREQFPAAAELVDKVESFVDKAKDDVVDAALDMADDLFGIIVTTALGFTDLSPAVRDALDKDGNGRINPSEALDVFKNPEDFLADEALFPPDRFPGGIRAQLDAAMHLGPGTDDDANDVFRDYDPNLFKPLRDTTAMAKLALLGPDGLNQLVRTLAGRSGNAAGLADLYGQAAPAVGDVAAANWAVPNNVMLGWHKSLDAEYQWRTGSPRDGRSYGLGTMWLFEDCVARDTVMRRLFASPVEGVDAFADAGDPASTITDGVGATSTVSVVSGPTAVRDGKTYVGAATRFATTTTDNYFPPARLQVRTSVTPEGAGASYGPYVAAEPDAFGLTGADGAYTVRVQGRDGCGTAGAVDARTWLLDATAPAIAISSPVDGATYTTDAAPPLSAAISDGGSGVASSSATLDAAPHALGAPVDTFWLDPGLHTVAVTASDALGNTGTSSVTFRVRASAASLLANVDRARSLGLITDARVYKGLRDSLLAAAQSHLAGKHATEWNQVGAFVNKVEAQLGQGIDQALGVRLISYANDLIAAQG
jgi:hypothetical protein